MVACAASQVVLLLFAKVSAEQAAVLNTEF